MEMGLELKVAGSIMLGCVVFVVGYLFHIWYQPARTKCAYCGQSFPNSWTSAAIGRHLNVCARAQEALQSMEAERVNR